MNGDQNNDWRFQRTKLDAPVTAASRVMPGPSNTNWNSTFSQNNPATLPTTYSHLKALGFPGSQPMSVGASRIAGSQSRPGYFFDLSMGESAGDPSNFYKNRTTDMDLTSRDHQLYGAGSDYGFND